MGIITGAKILTSASPTMNSPTVTNLTTTTLTASGTGTGYFVERITYPNGVTSTVFLNSICDSQTLIWLQPLAFAPNTLPTGGSSMPYTTIGAATSGSYTITSAVASSSALALDVLLINY